MTDFLEISWRRLNDKKKRILISKISYAVVINCIVLKFTQIMHSISSIIVCVFKFQLFFFVIASRIASKLNEYFESDFAMSHAFMSNVRKVLKSFVDVKKLSVYNIYSSDEDDSCLHSWMITNAMRASFKFALKSSCLEVCNSLILMIWR